MTETSATPDDAPTGGAPPRRERRSDRSPWYWLLLVPILVLIYPPLFNSDGPKLGGLPFFYWYQLAMVPVSVVTTAIVYLKTRTDGGDR
jgi:hypothetical protein